MVVVCVLSMPLLGIFAVFAPTAFAWLVVNAGIGAYWIRLAGARRAAGALVAVMAVAPSLPIVVWLAFDASVAPWTTWRPWALSVAAGIAGWLLVSIGPVIAGIRARRHTRLALALAGERIEATVSRWGDVVKIAYRPRPALPARIGRIA